MPVFSSAEVLLKAKLLFLLKKMIRAELKGHQYMAVLFPLFLLVCLQRHSIIYTADRKCNPALLPWMLLLLLLVSELFFICSRTMKVARCIALFLFSKRKSAQLSSPLTPEHLMRSVKDLISLLVSVLLTSDNQMRSNTRGVCIISVIPHHCLSVQV